MVDKDRIKTFYYKGKPYFIKLKSKLKLEGKWVDCIIYTCLYHNEAGMDWVRTAEDFYSKFKEYENTKIY